MDKFLSDLNNTIASIHAEAGIEQGMTNQVCNAVKDALVAANVTFPEAEAKSEGEAEKSESEEKSGDAA